jgi:hypothetical protein
VGTRADLSREVRDLIRKMSRANPIWGASRIHGELLKLGIEVSQATVGQYCPEPRPIHPPSAGAVVAFPQVGGLHHRYERRAA